MQNHINSSGNVLDHDGSLLQRGYSTQAQLTYNRKHIKAPPWRIKEWDFYQVSKGSRRLICRATDKHCPSIDLDVQFVSARSNVCCDGDPIRREPDLFLL